MAQPAIWWGGGPCDYSVTPSPNWTLILIWDCLGSGFGFMGTGLWTLDFGLGLDKSFEFGPFPAEL